MSLIAKVTSGIRNKITDVDFGLVYFEAFAKVFLISKYSSVVAVVETLFKRREEWPPHPVANNLSPSAKR